MPLRVSGKTSLRKFCPPSLIDSAQGFTVTPFNLSLPHALRSNCHHPRRHHLGLECLGEDGRRPLVANCQRFRAVGLDLWNSLRTLTCRNGALTR